MIHAISADLNFPPAASGVLFEHDLFGNRLPTFGDALGLQHSRPPTIEGDARPYCLNEAEWPRALQKAVDGTQRTSCGEGENKPRAAIFQSIEDQHGGDGRETEKAERAHARRGDTERQRGSRAAAFKPGKARRAKEQSRQVRLAVELAGSAAAFDLARFLICAAEQIHRRIADPEPKLLADVMMAQVILLDPASEGRARLIGNMRDVMDPFVVEDGKRHAEHR